MAVGYAYSVLRDFDQAQDAVQSAFAEAYGGLANLREPMAFPAWLRRIVYKHCDRLTRGRRIPTVSLDQALEIPADLPSPQELAEQNELHASVLKAIDSLPENERTATTLFYINGYSQSEVAGFLDVPVTTLKNWLYGARNRLRQEMIGMVEDALKRNAPGDGFGKSVKEKLMGLEWVHRRQTHLGCLQGCMGYLGACMSAGWLCGGSGWAFAMRIHNELCPAGIIAWAPPAQLGRNVGYETELLAPGAEEVTRQQEIVWRATNKALDEGRPCIGFAMESWESYLIYGYDDDGYFYRPVFTGGGHFSRHKMGTEVPCVMTFIKLVEPAADALVVKDALDFALRFAADQNVAPGWGGPPEDFSGGLAGYDLWMDAIGSGRADGHGAAYNAAVYADLRRLAVDFLKEAGERLAMQAAFGESIGHYEAAADRLQRVSDLFPMPADPAYIQDAGRRGAAVEELAAARRAEDAGLEALRKLRKRL